MPRFRACLALLALLCTLPARTQTMSAPAAPLAPKQATHWPTRDGQYTIPNFRFGTGESLPELKLHYLTLGTLHRDRAGHADNAVLLLHGTGGDATSLLNPLFSDVLFGPGQPLDITRYFLILPDDIGHGQSSRPSDGLHARFPAYDYDDMVRSQHHRCSSKPCTSTISASFSAPPWAACRASSGAKRTPVSQTRSCPLRLPARPHRRPQPHDALHGHRKHSQRDPAWQNGEYREQPAEGLRTANEMLLIMGSAPLIMQKAAPTREAAEKYVSTYLARTSASTDANNMIFYLDASRNYDPSAHLDRIQVPVLYINSADDFINPPELGIAERMAKQMPKAKFVLIPISDETRGHGTHTKAALWKDNLIDLLARSESR